MELFKTGLEGVHNSSRHCLLPTEPHGPSEIRRGLGHMGPGWVLLPTGDSLLWEINRIDRGQSAFPVALLNVVGAINPYAKDKFWLC